jgi:hypothetical protein
MCLVVTILFYLKFLKLYLSDRSVIEKVVENLPNPNLNGAGHLPNDSRFLLHPVLVPQGSTTLLDFGHYDFSASLFYLLTLLFFLSTTTAIVPYRCGTN